MNELQAKEQIRSLLRTIQVQEHFVAPISESVIHQFEQTKWFTLPDDYWWFVRHLGQGGVGFETLGIVQVSEHLHLFHAVKEAKHMEDFVPLTNFLLLQFLNEGDFYYIDLLPYRTERETAPIYRWNESEGHSEKAYDNFYSYFIHQMENGIQKKKRGDKDETNRE